MYSLIDTLYEKRFCLPQKFNYNMTNEKYNMNSCLCGNYNHIACILQGKLQRKNIINDSLNKINILSIGVNRGGDILGNSPGIHAEHDAINKIKPIYECKKLQNINLLVIRLSKQKKLQSSKPCINCIYKMKSLPERKGYKIKNIYYSNESGDIVKTNLSSLEKETPHYSTYYKHKMSKKQKFTSD